MFSAVSTASHTMGTAETYFFPFKQHGHALVRLLEGFVLMACKKKIMLYTVFINGGSAERPGFEYMRTRLGRPAKT